MQTLFPPEVVEMVNDQLAPLFVELFPHWADEVRCHDGRYEMTPNAWQAFWTWVGETGDARESMSELCKLIDGVSQDNQFV